MSSRYEDRVEAKLDLVVYGLVLQHTVVFFNYFRKKEDFDLHQALYRKWRPRTFEEVYGQDHITSILKYEVANSKFSHAYLFCGSRGTGKTTCAKILAKAVNCLSPVNGNPCGKCQACLSIEAGTETDILEMDAASNNGVDNIRDIRDEVVYSPSNLKYRVYIIDEVHMLSTSAFNALLKTLEEPPEHVVFILATTELHKLPATIISRCQRFDFRRIATNVLTEHLLRIAKAENIEIDESAATLLAKHAQGGMRDAISLLDLCAGSRQKIDNELVYSTVGSSGRDNMLAVVKAIAEKDYDSLFGAVDEVVASSRDIAVFWQDLISIYRDLLVVKTSKNAVEYLDLTDSEIASLSGVAKMFTIERMSYHCGMLEEAYLSMQKANAVKRIVAEMTLVRMCDERLSSTPEAMLSRISALESREFLASSVAVVTTQSADTSVTSNEKPKRAPKKPKFDDDDEDFRSDAPTTMKKSEKVSTQTASDKNVRVLRPFKSRAEVLDRMIGADPMSASFFKNAKWYTDESGRMIVKFNSTFDIDNMRVFGGEEIFIKVVSQVTGKALSKKDLICEANTESKKDELIDKILEAAED